MTDQARIDWMFAQLSKSEVCRLLDFFGCHWWLDYKTSNPPMLMSTGGGRDPENSLRIKDQAQAVKIARAARAGM